MCDFDKTRHIARNRDKYLEAAREGRSVDSVYWGMVFNRLLCGAVSVGLVIILIVAIASNW